MLTERHLQIFIALAEEQHFGDAARVIGITQPPLSQGLRRLEALVGAKLFERGQGRVELTAAGAALLPYARRALTSIEGCDRLRWLAIRRDRRSGLGWRRRWGRPLVPRWLLLAVR